ncbi:calcium channel flower [Tetranychus urticae]|uniref:Calcium channel flower n=1 Tax=Tetranychus urticae TaxID=32264 RepID=T1KRY5_TETUR|nr:calcium channel flower [Tetranychus urticae]
MISPGDGPIQQQQGIWWVDSWRSQIVTGLSLLQVVFGIITSISILSPLCIPAGLLQVGAAIVVLAIEAPSFVTFIRFAQPIGIFFEDKPLWIKCAAYAGLAIIPCLFGCFGLFFLLGFLTSLGSASVYGLLLIGRKASRDDMRFQAAGSPTGGPYSPTSP